MKRTEKVSIGRLSFTLELDAYELIREYLDKLQEFYDNQPDGEEVIESIEERMAELLIERCGINGIVNINIANEVITIIGKPEIIEESDADTKNKKEKRFKLYRDVDNSKLGGVCSGLATALNIDVTIIRAILVVLLILFMSIIEEAAPILVISYILMWIITPAADSPIKRRKMGEATTHKGMSNISKATRVTIGAILLIIGISILCCTLFSISIPIIGGINIVSYLEELEYGTLTLSEFNIPLLMTLFMVELIIPSIILLYEGIILTFDINRPKWRPGLWLFIVWLVIGFTLFSLLIAYSLNWLIL